MNCSSVVQRMPPLLWLLTASSLSTGHSKFAGLRTMVVIQSYLLECMYQVLFRRTSLTLLIRSSLVVSPPTSTKSRLWNYLRVLASSGPSTWSARMALERQRCVRAIMYSTSLYSRNTLRASPSLNTLIRQSQM